MNTGDYEKAALRTEADQARILERLALLGPGAMRLDNAARGLAGDAGEVCSAVMRYIEYGHPLDVTNLKEEVGDCLWRLAQVCAAAGFTLGEAMGANLRKLEARYPDGYSDGRAAGRDRAAERVALTSSKAHGKAKTLPRYEVDNHGFGHRVLDDDGEVG